MYCHLFFPTTACVVVFTLNESYSYINKTKGEEENNQTKLQLNIYCQNKVGPIYDVNINVNDVLNDFYPTFLYIFEVCFTKAIFNVKDKSYGKLRKLLTLKKLKDLYWCTPNIANYYYYLQCYEYTSTVPIYTIVLTRVYRTKIQHATLLIELKSNSTSPKSIMQKSLMKNRRQ